MGANAATKLIKVLENLSTILAIELFNASQALSYRKHKTSDFLEEMVEEYRKSVPLVKEDVVMAPFIEKSKQFLEDYKLRDFSFE